MVHASSHPGRGHHGHLHPDAKRIVGLAGAISFNLALLLLLLMPMSAPLPTPEVITTRVIDIFERVKPPTPPPVHVDVVKPTTPRASTTRPVEVPTPPAESVVIDPEGTLPAPPIDTAPSTATTVEPATSGPLPGVRLEYAEAPAPAYPRDALHEGIEGTVLLQVLVDVDGRPLQVQVQQSSGNRQLDNAARRQVLERWRFRPAMKDGRAVQAIGLVPIAFNLDR